MHKNVSLICSIVLVVMAWIPMQTQAQPPTTGMIIISPIIVTPLPEPPEPSES